MLLTFFCVVTLTLSCSALHLVTVSESRLAQMSYPKLSGRWWRRWRLILRLRRRDVRFAEDLAVEKHSSPLTIDGNFPRCPSGAGAVFKCNLPDYLPPSP